MTLGKRLAQARKMAGLTQEQAGQAIGVADGTISEYERNRRRPDPEMLAALARLYRVSADWLLGLVDDPMPPASGVASFRPVALHGAEPAGARREVSLLIEALEAAAAHLRERYAHA